MSEKCQVEEKILLASAPHDFRRRSQKVSEIASGPLASFPPSRSDHIPLGIGLLEFI